MMRPAIEVLLQLVLLLAGTVAPVAGQTLTYDIASFSPPPGWKREQPQDSMRFTDIDQAAGTYCILGVYASTPGSGGTDAAFAREWDLIIRNSFPTGAPPKPSGGRTPAGLTYLEGGATVSRDGRASYAHLSVFAAGDRTMSILLLATNEAALGARSNALKAFFESLRINVGQSYSRVPADAGPATSPKQAPVSNLTYQVPAGWSRTESSGAVTLARTVDLGFGQRQEFRIVIMPQESVAGNPVYTYQALWRRLIGGISTTQFHPLPLRVRLRGGAAMLYDGTQMSLRQNNAQTNGFLYVVLNGGTAVPLLGFYNGWDAELDRALRQLFDSVRLPGAGGQARPLFTGEEIAGVWRSSSSTLANWVDAAGNYRGDASIATGETFTIRADGTYESQFAAISGASRMRQHDVGRFTIEDDFLVLRPDNPGQQPSRQRITGVGRTTDGRGSFLLLGITRDDFPFLSAGSTRPGAGDLYVSVR
ncbi:MAG: hypothetical protein LAP13_10675 [Acidobacteriia bacterium]|nr:hypothetical protein [Terriglobia bacterium]